MTAAAAVQARPVEASTPLPVGFRIELDHAAKQIEPGVWFGGSPARVLRITAAGRAAFDALHAGAPVTDHVSGLLARRLTDAGLAHPVPPSAPVDLTVVVPVHDRPDSLDRCLAALGGAYPVIVVDDASADALAVARVADRHGARIVRLDVNRGPAGARNAGLAQVRSTLVAFADSDTEVTPSALAALAAHLADPLVAAVAPRIRATGRATTAAARYTRARCSLDLGPHPARVAPYTPVSYLPSAVLVARTGAIDAFDEQLRYGEDVDLVWRLTAAGQRVRYEPAVTANHHDPVTWRALLSRRFHYGTSAAPLSQRHPRNLAPLVVHPWYTTAAVAVLARRPVLAAVAAGGALVTTRRAVSAQGLPRDVVRPRHIAEGVGQTLLGTARYATQLAPLPLLAGLAHRRTRLPAAVLLLAPAVAAWRRERPQLDPVRFTAAALADDAAYGAGVLAGCLAHRTSVPLRPRRAGS